MSFDFSLDKLMSYVKNLMANEKLIHYTKEL